MSPVVVTGIALGGLLGFGIGHIGGALPSWKYEFLIIGALCCIWGIVMYIFLPDSPVTAKGLTQREKRIAVERLRLDQTGIENKYVKSKTWAAVTFRRGMTIRTEADTSLDTSSSTRSRTPSPTSSCISSSCLASLAIFRTAGSATSAPSSSKASASAPWSRRSCKSRMDASSPSPSSLVSSSTTTCHGGVGKRAAGSFSSFCARKYCFAGKSDFRGSC